MEDGVRHLGVEKQRFLVSNEKLREGQGRFITGFSGTLILVFQPSELQDNMYLLP